MRRVAKSLFTATSILLAVVLLIALFALDEQFANSYPGTAATIGRTVATLSCLFCAIFGARTIITKKIGDSDTEGEALVMGFVLTFIGIVGLAFIAYCSFIAG